MPFGMFSHTMAISVPSGTSARVVIIFISPAKAGSGEFEFNDPDNLLVRQRVRRNGRGRCRYPPMIFPENFSDRDIAATSGWRRPRAVRRDAHARSCRPAEARRRAPPDRERPRYTASRGALMIFVTRVRAPVAASLTLGVSRRTASNAPYHDGNRDGVSAAGRGDAENRRATRSAARSPRAGPDTSSARNPTSRLRRAPKERCRSRRGSARDPSAHTARAAR